MIQVGAKAKVKNRVLALAFVLCVPVTACHWAEKSEAAKLAKALQEASGNLTASNSQEAQIMNSLTSSIGQHTLFDVGNSHGNAGAECANFASQLRGVAGLLSAIHARLTGLKLQKPATQAIRDGAVSTIARRLAFVNGVIFKLDDSARTFPTIRPPAFSMTPFSDMMNAKWPNAYLQLQNQLQSNRPPTDSFDSLVTDLRTKYELTASDLK